MAHICSSQDKCSAPTRTEPVDFYSRPHSKEIKAELNAADLKDRNARQPGVALPRN
jgi:hypothetical protein